MTTIHLLTHTRPNGDVIFATGTTLSQGRRAMRAAMLAYGVEHGMLRTWFRGEEVGEHEVTLGAGYVLDGFVSHAVTGILPEKPVPNRPLTAEPLCGEFSTVHNGAAR